MTTQNKVYRINGKEIKQAGAWEDDKNFGHNDVNDVVNQLLEALSDKEEECKHLDMGKHPFTGVPMCTKCGWWNKEEPKQEECGACDYEEKYNRKITPSRHTCTTKQSTSLKEVPLRDKIDFIQDRLLNDHVTTEQSITEVLEVFQSHLVKEIETLEPAKYIKMDEECLDGYTFAKEDIIKIINNIIK